MSSGKKRTSTSILVRILLYANVIVVAGLLMSGYSGTVNPASYSYVSVIGFSFPVFLVANALFIGLWVVVRIRNVIVPFVGFLLAYSPVRTYIPLNISALDDQDAELMPDMPNDSDVTTSRSIKVLSYNILGFNPQDAQEGEPNPIMKYIADSNADIVCLQEYGAVHGQDSLQSVLDARYEYMDTIHSDGYEGGSDIVAILSKYPIVHKEHIYARTRGNAWGAFDVLVDGDTLHVINAHLQTVGMSEEEKLKFGNIIRGKSQGHAVKSESKMIIKKLASSAAMRAGQADAIAEYIRKKSGQRIIFCGDINDHPLSYVHHTIARQLNDCYVSSGFWTGYSYKYNSMYVRIDNIMCSEHYEPTCCIVDKSVSLSDHYPIYCILRSNIGQE